MELKIIMKRLLFFLSFAALIQSCGFNSSEKTLSSSNANSVNSKESSAKVTKKHSPAPKYYNILKKAYLYSEPSSNSSKLVNQKATKALGEVYYMSIDESCMVKIIESKAGANYLNDWKGVEFTLTRNQYSYEYTVENQPVLGKLKVHKDGEKLEYSNNNFKTNTLVSLEGIKFSLFAKEDVYVKDKVFYKKNQKFQGCFCCNLLRTLPAGYHADSRNALLERCSGK